MGNNLITIDKNIYESLEGELVKLRQRVADLEEKLYQQELEFNSLADNVPGMIYKFQLSNDGKISFPYISSRCRDFYELEPQEVKQNPDLMFEMVHEDDFAKLQEAIQISAQYQQKWESEWRIITQSGRTKWFYGISQPVAQANGDIVWDGCVIDISQRKLATEKLKQREALLEGMKNATSCLLTTQDYDKSINTALAEIGKATATDRIYIFQNYSDKLTQELFLSQRWEWVNDGINSEINYPLLKNLSYDNFSPFWYEKLSQGKSIITIEDESLIQGSRSIFVIPIQVKGKWWGFIGFEDYTTLRQWSEAEQSILQAFSMNLGSAISQRLDASRIATYEAEYKLRQLNQDLELRVKERTTTLAETETRLKRLAANVPGMLYQYQIYPNGDVRLSYISDGCHDLFGVKPEQILRNPDIINQMIHPDDVVGFDESVANSVKTLNKWEYEGRIITPSKELKWLQGFSRLQKQSDDSIFCDGFLIDITERKIAEEISQEKEQFLRNAYDGSEHVIFVVDVLEDNDFVLQGWNLACEHGTGMKSEDIKNKPLEEIFGEVKGKEIRQNYLNCVESNAPITYEERLNFGEHPRWWFTTLNPLKDVNGRIYRLVGTTSEITELKKAEQVIRSSEQNLRTLLDSVYDAIIIHDLKGNILDVNEQMLQMYGVNRDQVTQMSIVADLSSSDNPKEQFTQIIEKVMSGDSQLFEWKAKRPHDNSTFDVEVFLRRVTLNSQDIILANVRDISERKKVEAEIQAKQHFIQRITDSSPNTIYIYDLEKQQNIYTNHEIATILGYSRQQIQEMANNLFVNIIHPEDLPKVFSQNQKISTAKDGEIYETEYRVKQADGKYRWLYSRDTVFNRNEDGLVTQILGVATDITERKLAEIELQNTLHELKTTQTQLIQSEKMSSLGQMVAGVAHEINNPVNFIHGNLTPATQYTQDLLKLLELYQQHYPNPPEDIQEEIEAVELEFLKEDFLKMLNSMKQGTQRIREIVLSLRNFSRLDEAQFKAVDIHKGIDSTLMLLQNRLKAKPNFPRIQIAKQYSSLPPVDCFPSQLNQVLMNILANAIDALESQKSMSTPQIQIHTKLIDNNRIAIHIYDNGSGIPPQIQSKLFDPFFTTKEVGKGTGNGLSISYQIVVNKHGGNLSYKSTPGEGTEFIIEIPVNQTNN
ncbi:PAS domain S-box [Rivularia sp. PCC 7116]|uniref:PAS domain S-box protein n=1 Tax=Rivularia sp. PCC 7116 TaxID=373994 RepID=UPI00029EDCCC|nr:PAS domain S-box protein [Rivularia sp. PCC 7116]AFY56772.1 PAS domain S-box [Rivularia sp. PCC 7116]